MVHSRIWQAPRRHKATDRTFWKQPDSWQEETYFDDNTSVGMQSNGMHTSSERGSCFSYLNNENILEEIKVDPVENKLA